MTLPANIAPIVDYIGNGTTSTFAFAFRAFTATDILVTVIPDTDTTHPITLVLGVDYTQTFATWPSLGGSISLIDAGQAWLITGKLKTGYTLEIAYNTNPRQLSQFRNLGPLAPIEMEKSVDQDVMMISAILAKLNRALIISGTGPVNPSLPNPAGHNNQILQANAGGDGFTFGPTVDNIYNARDAAIAAANNSLTYATNSQNSATNSAASATASAASATSAANQAVNAGISAGQAATSATNAANQVTLAAAQVALAHTEYLNAQAQAAQADVNANRYVYTSIVNLTFADSPYAITAADKGKLFYVDTTLGNFTFNLPQLSTMAADFKFAAIKTDGSINTMTVVRNFVDTINGNPTFVVNYQAIGAAIRPSGNSNTDWFGRYLTLEGTVSTGTGGGGFKINNTTQVLGANGQVTITTNPQQMVYVKSSGGQAILNTAPNVGSPPDGTVITYVGEDDTDYCVIPYADVAGGFLIKGDMYLQKGSTLTATYNITRDRYVEFSRTNA